MRMKRMSKRYFVLQKDGEDTEHVFTSNKLPRAAALKAANRGFTDIVLRERGTKKLHLYQGSRSQIDAPKGKPDWMPDKIWEAKILKTGIKHL